MYIPHWINPEMKGQGPEEHILLSKNETVAKTTTKKVLKSAPPTKDPVRGAKLEKTAQEEGMTFFDAPTSFSPATPGSCAFHSSSKHHPQLTYATQPENPSQVSTFTSAEGTGLYKENTHSREKQFRASQTSATP